MITRRHNNGIRSNHERRDNNGANNHTDNPSCCIKIYSKKKSTEIRFTPTSEAATKVQEYEGSKTIEAVQWTGENIQDVWETVRRCATSQEMRILPATGRIEIIWHQGREIAFPGDYFVKPEVSSRLQIIKVMGKKYFEENYRIKQDNSMRNSENGQIRED